MTQNSEDVLKRENPLYIAHEYQQIPTTINKEYLVDQIEFYVKNWHFTVAKFHGFSMTDSEDKFIPTVLTERPIKGPLSNLFEKESVTPEQKFCMICGILDAVRFIHEAGFAHLNLNPSTIYINEELQVKVCDFIFVPPFDISIEKVKSDKKSYKFSMLKKPDQTNFYKNGLYTAPEIIEGNQRFNEMADIYSVGLIIYFILFEKDPTFSNGLIEYPSEIDQQWQNLIDKCLNKNISLRPTAASNLRSLLDEEKKLKFISSITKNPQPAPISTNTKTYLFNIMEIEKVIDIHSKITHRIFDEQTFLAIQAAEKGDVESLEKIGFDFLNGEHGLPKDEELAFDCFLGAAQKGSVKSMIRIGEMSENGIGREQYLAMSIVYYQKAYIKMNDTDPERPRIEEKLKTIREILKSHISRNKYPNESEAQSISLPKIDINNYYPGEDNEFFIGLKSNANSTDYLVYEKETNEPYLAKVLYKAAREALDGENIIQLINREIKIASMFNHPSLINFIGYNKYDIRNSILKSNLDNPTLISDFIPRCTLKEMIESPKSSWSSTAKLKAIIGIASGMSVLYSHNINYKSLGPLNIFLDENYEPIIDFFGLSRQNNNTGDATGFGNIVYLAPELISKYNSFYKYEVDSYSFGIILYQILTRTPSDKVYPAKLNTDIINLKLNDYRPDDINDMDPIFAYIIKSCWNVSIDARLDALTIYNILIEAVKRNEEILPDIDLESIKEYIKRLDSKGQIPPPPRNRIKEPIQYETHTDEKELLNIKEIESLNIKEIDLKEYKKIRDLGSGGFSKVFLIKNIKTGKEYAAKQYYINSKDSKDDFIRELTIHSELDHPLITKIIGYSLTDFNQIQSMIIIMEYVKNGTLERILKAERNKITIDEWNETTKLINLYGIASAISYLHQHNILHLDIKPFNILIDDFIFPKICDFSISIKIGYNILEKVVGTVPYIAPEVLNRSTYTYKSDVYSFGILLYIMKYKKVPFDNCDKCQYLYQVAVKKERPNLNKSVPKVYRNLIRSCWDDDPNKRPTFDYIINELEQNKEFITKGVNETLYKSFIDIVKSEFQNKKSEFSTKNLNELYQLQKSKMIEDPNITYTLYDYLDSYFNEDFEDLEEIKIIEEDPESTISEYLSKKTGRKFTVTTSNIPIESIKEAREEAEQLSKLNHPTIEKFYGFNISKNPENPMLFSESYSFQSLKKIIENERKGNRDLDWNNTTKLINIYGIAVGMKYLHENGIHHPALNPKNIHVDSNYQPKLSGIGIYTRPQTSQIFSKLTSVGINEKYYYFSPEYLRGSKHITEKSDVYSYAVVVYEILTNKKPYKLNNTNRKDDCTFEFVSNKEKGEYQPIFDDEIPGFYMEIIQKCMSQNPEERPSFSYIVEKLENDSSSLKDDFDENSFKNYQKFIQNL